MTGKKEFEKLVEEHLSTLEFYVPVVAKVHGKDHPEFLEVKEVYDELVKKINDGLGEGTDLSQEFAKLREITNTYEVPGDTCETYEAVYEMLSKLDEAY